MIVAARNTKIHNLLHPRSESFTPKIRIFHTQDRNRSFRYQLLEQLCNEHKCSALAQRENVLRLLLAQRENVLRLFSELKKMNNKHTHTLEAIENERN
ncbi:hypothetical protein QL285_055371 [Trifolium repens]|nr:hypothetical protein QL285_055371 [Trifolium repens]